MSDSEPTDSGNKPNEQTGALKGEQKSESISTDHSENDFEGGSRQKLR